MTRDWEQEPTPGDGPPQVVPAETLPDRLFCIVCRFWVELDDCAIALPHGVICLRCRNRVLETEHHELSKRLRRDATDAANKG